mgnify:CR=1 FL=1
MEFPLLVFTTDFGLADRKILGVLVENETDFDGDGYGRYRSDWDGVSHGSIPVAWADILLPQLAATGRFMFPGFVARSRANPASELHDPATWSRLWEEARTQMARINQGNQNEVRFRRWEAGHPQCA